LAETAFEEHESARILADYAEVQGLTVERGVAGIPTAFVATYGSGSPVISVLGEFDALPGISQKASPVKEPLNAGAAGHGCGHNLFGAASLGAAIAIKEQIEAGTLKGTVKFIGTPSEEMFFGKIWMIKEGIWDGVDVNVSWHPGATTEADVQSTLALVDFKVEFFRTNRSRLFRPLEWPLGLRRLRALHHRNKLLPRARSTYRAHALPHSRRRPSGKRRT
jgi:Metal-dependent amidase/aminoacylase/carboxypeptidase